MGRRLVRGCVSAVPETFRASRGYGVFALIVLIVPTGAAARGTSCPLATRVSPLGSTSLARYDVVLTDGGSGDGDGIANGTCELDVAVCVASDDCPNEGVKGARVRSHGRAPAATRQGAAKLVAAALATLPGGMLVSDTEVAFDPVPPPPGSCGHARLRLAVDESAKRSPTMSLALAIQAVDESGHGSVHRDRLGLRCVPAARTGGSTPTCHAASGQCPGTSPAPSCGNGVREGDEACDGRDDALCPGACRPDCSCPVQAFPDNVAPQAAVQASSEQPGGPATATVDGSVGQGHEWIANGEPSTAVLRLVWPTAVTVDRVVLYGRVSPVGHILAITLESDDGHAVSFGPLPAEGRPLEIMLGVRTILALTLTITGSSGVNAGLGEIQVLAVSQPQPPVRPPPAPTPVPGAPRPAQPPPPVAGTTYYLSPTGSDSNPGTTRDRPWRTFGKVLNSSKPLQPGDTVVLLDGTYTPSTTGLPDVNCGDGGNAQNGIADRPITIRALNERQALLQSDGQVAAFTMQRCSWWRIEGLQAASQDSAGPESAGSPFSFVKVDHVTLRRLLGHHNNRQQNTQIFVLMNSTNVLFEECEAYFFHRHGFSIWQSRFVTLRRCYANSMLYGQLHCCSAVDNLAYGDEAVSLYGTSDSIVENSISENRANGFNIHGIPNPLDPSGNGGRHNRILGCVSLNDSLPLLVASRVGFGDGHGGTYCNAEGNVIRDFVAANTSGAGMYMRGAAGTLVENATLYHSTGVGGLVADNGDRELGGSCGSINPDGCSLTAQNVNSLGHSQGYGFLVSGFDNWLVEWSNAARNQIDYSANEPTDDGVGNIQHSTRTDAPEIGLGSGQCLLWVPDGSVLKNAANGRDIGATIVNRYIDGVVTTQPLWDTTTGAFPCGAVVAGINDGPIRCTNVHTRLNVNTNGCHLPASAP